MLARSTTQARGLLPRFERGFFRNFDIRLGGLPFRFLPHLMLGVFASLGPKSVWRGVKTSGRFWGSSDHHSLVVIRFFVMLFVRNSGRHSACYAGSLDARGRRSTGRFHGRVCSDAVSVPAACCPRRPRFRRLRPLLAPFSMVSHKGLLPENRVFGVLCRHRRHSGLGSWNSGLRWTL